MGAGSWAMSDVEDDDDDGAAAGAAAPAAAAGCRPALNRGA